MLLTLGACTIGLCSYSVCVCVSVCLSVTTLEATYPVYTSPVKFHRVSYGIFKVSVVWLLLKMLRSKVVA